MALTTEQMSAMEALADKWYWQVQEQGKWRYRYHVEALVRYYEAAPLEADVFETMIEYLSTQTNLTRINIHNKIVKLDGIWHTNRVWYETREGDTSDTNKLKRVRIYQALVKNCDEKGADGPYVVDNGCRWKVSHQFYWSVSSLPVLPKSESGVSYQLQGVTRDQDTGLFSCVIEKRERVQQDVPEYMSERTAFADRSIEQHLGVKQDKIASTGKYASVADGKIVKRHLSKNDDCTTDVTNDTTQEIAVKGAMTEVRVGVRGTETVIENRYMPEKADEKDLQPGTTVRNEETEGKRWNQRISTYLATAASWIRRACRVTLFEEVDTKIDFKRDDPGFNHQEVSLGSGHTLELSVDRTDHGHEITSVERKEKSVPESTVIVDASPEGTVRTVVDRNAELPAPTDHVEPGCSVRVEKTDGGRHNNARTEIVSGGGVKAETCTDTMDEHRHSTTENEAKDPGPLSEHASKGTLRTKIKQRTSRGTWDVITETREAKQLSERFDHGTVARSTTTTVYRNAEQITIPTPSENVEVEASGSVNEYGLDDANVRVTTYRPQGVSFVSGGPVVSVEESAGIHGVDVADGVGDVGTIIDVSQTPNEHGSKTWRRSVRTAHPKIESQNWTTNDGRYTYTHTLTVFRNHNSVPTITSGCYQTSVSVSINDYGLLDGSIHSVTRDGGSGGGFSGEQWDDSSTVSAWKMFKKDGKLMKQKFTANLRVLCSTYQNMWQEALKGDSMSDLGWVSKVDGRVARIYTNITESGDPVAVEE